jgi:glycosyltransferase involved in cell wall biosynthesis
MAVKVLHIIKSLGRGGAEMLLPETLQYHNRERFDFHYIYFLPWKNQMVEEIEKNGGKVSCFPASNNFQLMLEVSSVRDYIKANKIQIVHCHLPWAGILGRITGKIGRVPVVYTEHNKQERYHFGTRLLNLFTMNLLTKVLAVSQDVAESIHRNKPSLRTPVITIVNGVSTEKFDRKLFDGKLIKQQLGIPADAPVIGTIAVFRFQKRLDLWMDIAVQILRRNDKVHFIIVGDGPLKKQLLEKRDMLKLQDRIHMPGLQTEVRPYLAAFDLYMMSSIFEGLPLALLEAMSMECPVITTDAGGIKEVVRHNVEGLICSVEEPRKLIDYATDLLTDRRAATKSGNNARKRVEESFSLKRMVVELEKLYDSLL